MQASTRNLIKGLGMVTAGVAVAVAGIYLGELDDAPGASLAGIVLMLTALVLGIRVARRRT